MKKVVVVCIVLGLMLSAVPAFAQVNGERFMCRHRDNGTVQWAYVVGDDQPAYLAEGWVYGLRLGPVWTCPAPVPSASVPVAVLPNPYEGNQVLDVFSPVIRQSAAAQLYGITAAGDYAAKDAATLLDQPRALWLDLETTSAVLPAEALATGANYLLGMFADGEPFVVVRVDRDDSGLSLIWAAVLSDRAQADPLSSVWY